MEKRLSERCMPVWVTRLVAYTATALFAVGIGVMMTRHEMWRDEIQAWLLARDSATPWALLHNMRYEGHPGLWHLLLWVPARFTANPAAMQAVHAALATGAVFVLMRFAPFHLVTRLLLAGGYFFAYEWAVISRNYAISVLLFFLFAALHRRRWAWFPLQAALLFALCHGNIHSIVLVLVLAPALAIEYAVAYAGRRHEAQRALGRVVAGFLIVACGLVTGIRQAAPPTDSGFAQDWTWSWKIERARDTARRVFNAYLPLPRDAPDFWNSNRIAADVPPASMIPWALTILAVGCVFFLTQPWPIVPYLAGSLGLLTFFYVKYPGSYRHHGFLFLHFVVLLWMTWDYRRWRLPWRWVDAPFAGWHRYRDVLLWPLLAVHVAGTCVAVKNDWLAPFSQGKAAAAWLRDRYGDGAGVTFVGDPAPAVSTVVGYMPMDRIYQVGRGEFGSYVVWDRKYKHGGTLRDAVERLRAEQTNDLVLILDRPPPRLQGADAVSVATFTGPVIAGEQYHIYHVSNRPPRQAASGAR